MVSMNKLSTAQRVQVVKCLVDGNSIRATVRITGVAKNTVTKLLVDMGCASHELTSRALVNLPCKRIQCDEIWSFVYAKDKNVPMAMKGAPGVGSVWTWTAICADTKLIVGSFVGTRDAENARVFLSTVKSRLAGRVQLTTDGHRAYLDAVPQTFGDDIDYSMLIKIYGAERPGEARYSPPACIGCKKSKVIGKPDSEHVSTSFVERQNLTMRMSMRRFTRLTNGFSKKVENHIHAVSLHFAFYNFCRRHQSLGMTPAQAAGVADHAWSIEELVGLLD
jgi:IS1 family transposase